MCQFNSVYLSYIAIVVVPNGAVVVFWYGLEAFGRRRHVIGAGVVRM